MAFRFAFERYKSHDVHGAVRFSDGVRLRGENFQYETALGWRSIPCRDVTSFMLQITPFLKGGLEKKNLALTSQRFIFTAQAVFRF